MTSTPPRPLAFWRVVFGALAVLAIPAIGGVFSAARRAQASDIWGSNWGLLILLVAGLGLGALGLFGLTWTRRWDGVLRGLELAPRLPFFLRLILLAVILIVYPMLMMTPASGALLGTAWLRWYLFCWLAFAASVLLKGNLSGWHLAFAAGFVFMAVVARIASYFPSVTSYPLSIGWSEVSRYYDASLFFGQRIYGEAATPPVLHPALHLLLAIPFLFGNLPLWAHRFWMVFLTLALTGIVGLMLARFLALKPKVVFIVFAGWAFLFLMQAPLYLHLTIPVMIILSGYDANNSRKTLLAILFASAWVGISRINWFPVPAMLAAVLYFLDTPLAGRKWIGYLAKPALWFALGILTAFASQALYALLAVGNLAQFYSSTSSDLLWDRLLPNATFPLGVLPGIIIVSLPLWLVTGWILVISRRAWHPLRLAALLAALLVLFAGGLVVSFKIGGGGDLHNMDAYLVMLLLVSSILFWDRFTPEPGKPFEPRPVPWVLAALALVIPAWFAAQSLAPWPTRDFDAARAAVETIRARAEATVSQGGEVLFISERHLLALDEIKNIPLIEEYERDFLVEMVMSHNESYLNQFYNDLHNHRFALIVAEGQGYYLHDKQDSFSEESNLWVKSISAQLLCEYKQIPVSAGISLFVPRPAPTHCKFP